MIVTITLIRLLFKSNKHELISDQARGEDATCMLFDRNLKERVTLKHCKSSYEMLILTYIGNKFLQNKNSIILKMALLGTADEKVCQI